VLVVMDAVACTMVDALSWTNALAANGASAACMCCSRQSSELDQQVVQGVVRLLCCHEQHLHPNP
jgi:hypothetical protein